MNIKNQTTQLYLLLMLIVLSFMFATPSYAAEVVATSPSLFELLTLFTSPETAMQWITGIGFLCYVLTQLLPWIPDAYSAKLPKWFISFINYLAGNYKATKNGKTIK